MVRHSNGACSHCPGKKKEKLNGVRGLGRAKKRSKGHLQEKERMGWPISAVKGGAKGFLNSIGGRGITSDSEERGDGGSAEPKRGARGGKTTARITRGNKRRKQAENKAGRAGEKGGKNGEKRRLGGGSQKSKKSGGREGKRGKRKEGAGKGALSKIKRGRLAATEERENARPPFLIIK